MPPIPPPVAAKLPHLPDTPGVYLFRDGEGRMLYIGKAARLRSRVRSYFGVDHSGSLKTGYLVGQIADVETIVVPVSYTHLTLPTNREV